MKIENIQYEHFFNPSLLVTDPEIFSKKTESILTNDGMTDQKKFSDEGLFSKRIFGDMDSVEEYSCECGKYTGKFYEGCQCDKCDTEVKYVSQSIERCGWIDLSFAEYNEDGVKIKDSPLGFHLIKYIAYMFLEKVIGRENLKNIIHIKNTITVAGELDMDEITAIQESDPKMKYWYIGIEEFYNKYNEVLDYYYEINDHREYEIYNEYQNKDDVFTTKIPVLPISLRSAMRTADGLKLDEINIKYQLILKDLEMLKEPSMIPLIRAITIEDAQAVLFMLSENIINNIKSKNGLIRSQICGTRVNFSARNIITPAEKDIKMDEIEIPYKTFLELYKFEIINTLKVIDNISLKQAELEWYNATLKFDEKVWLIMEKMAKENELGCFLNRNPTIALGSILYVKIKKVKKNFNDVTMGLSNLVLSLMGADYDGDVLNLISIKDKSLRAIFKDIISPVNLIINPSNGEFNNSLNLEKDQVLGINALLR